MSAAAEPLVELRGVSKRFVSRLDLAGRIARRLGARMHAQRRVEVEHDRLDLQEIGGRRARVAVAAVLRYRQRLHLRGDSVVGVLVSGGKWHGIRNIVE